MDVNTVTEPTLADVRRAQSTIRGAVHRTPIIDTRTLSEITGTRLQLKAENLQRTGSFKARGAVNACAALTSEERARGVIAVSAGNHAAAVAYGARMIGAPATVVMPDTAPKAKIAAVENYGGKVVLTDGGRLLERLHEIQAEEGQFFIHPFDNPHVLAGAGTVGLEIVEDSDEPPATIVVPVGGGGLISGIAVAVKALRPEVRVIGVEPEGSNIVSQSLRAGKPLSVKLRGSIADGLNAPWSAPLALGIIQRLVDDVVTVSDKEIGHAMALVMERCKFVVEPAGAAGVAALLAGKVPGVSGSPVITILSGGNFDLRRLPELIP